MKNQKVVLDPDTTLEAPILESRQLRVMPSKPGGTSRGKSMSFRVILPRPWLSAMGVDQENRDVIVSFDGSRIIVTAATTAEPAPAPEPAAAEAQDE